MFGRLLPKETSFFDFFEQHAALTVRGAREFLGMVSEGSDVRACATAIKTIEHEGDTVTHHCMEALHKTFITPLEREDIHELICKLDDILDLIDGAARRIVTYELNPSSQELHDLAEVLVHATEAVQRAVQGLRDMKNAKAILNHCVEINRYENQSDTIYSSAMARLFKDEPNAVMIIKWKEIYECIENATDRCEDAANVIEGVVLEHA